MKEDLIKKFENIYDLQNDAIFRFCLIRVSSREQALDITQETFLRFWQSLQKEEEILNERAFLFTVARRLVIDFYRKKKSISLEGLFYSTSENNYDILDNKTDMENLIDGADGRFLIDKINDLPISLRDPIYFRFVEDLSPPEIGKILNISTNAASVRINRGVSLLKKITGDSSI